MHDCWIALAGSLTYVPMFAVWFGLFCSVKSPSQFSPFIAYKQDLETAKGWFGEVFEQAAFVNIVLFIFNLLIPAYPLGGGRCLAATLVQCGKPVHRAAKILSITGSISACCTIALGVIFIVFGDGGGLFVFFGLWFLWESFNLYRNATLTNVFNHPFFDHACYRNAGGGAVGAAAVGGDADN